MSYKYHYQFQNVRPSKVLKAAQYLVQTSSIFKNEGIHVVDNYARNPINNDQEWSEFFSKGNMQTLDDLPYSANAQVKKNVDSLKYDGSVDNGTDDEWCEETERPSGGHTITRT